jgi:hypothetical protein
LSRLALMGPAVKIANQPTSVGHRVSGGRSLLAQSALAATISSIPAHSLGLSIDQEDFRIALLHGQGSTCVIWGIVSSGFRDS